MESQCDAFEGNDVKVSEVEAEIVDTFPLPSNMWTKKRIPHRGHRVRTRGSCLKISRLVLFTMVVLVFLSMLISKGDPSTM